MCSTLKENTKVSGRKPVNISVGEHILKRFSSCDKENNFEMRIEKVPTGKLLVSSYRLNGLYDAIKSLPEKSYLIGPQYISRRTGILKDFQPAVTGSPLVGETFLIAANREPAEEIGLVAESHTHFEKISTRIDRCKLVTTYRINADKLKPYDPSIHSFEKNDGIDNKKAKIQVVIYGTLDTLEILVKNITCRKIADDSCVIGAARIILAKDILDGIEWM